MGKGSSPQQQVVSTGLPEYVDPYFKRLLKGAEEATMPYYPDDPNKYGDLAGKSTYVPYEGDRLTASEDYGDITKSRDMIRNTATSPLAGMTTAVGTQNEGIAGLRNLALNAPSFTASDFTASSVDPYSGFQASPATAYGGFQESQFTRGAGSEFDFDPARQFTGAEVQQYMDPYMQNVVDVQKREAIRDFDRGQAGRDASAVTAGAFGGSRQAVAQGMADQNLQQRLGDIQQIGSQAAFDRAMKAFESDRAAQMGVDKSRAAELARVQGIDIGELGRTEAGAASEAARRQAAEAAEQARVQGLDASEAARIQAGEAEELARTQGIDVSEAARVQSADAAEQARIQAALEAQRYGTAGLYGDLMGAGRGLLGLGELARGTDIQGAQLLETLGRDVRGEDQARLDLAYQDFLRQQDYPISQYERFAGLLSGVPTGNLDRTTTQYASYNPIQQALGAGISALGLYRGLGGGYGGYGGYGYGGMQ
jgi:hypothetical protein